MTVSIELTGGGSIVAWQTSAGILFQEFNADLQPIGAATLVETGTADWLTATALSDGGFSIIWDGSAMALPMAQDYGATGAAVGAPYTLTTSAPAAPLAFASQTVDQGGSGPWTAPLANGDSVTVSYTNGIANSLTMQQTDPAGNPIGTAYVHAVQGLPGMGHVEIASLANGNYAVSFVDESNYGAQSFVDLFGALGNHIAGDQVATTGYQEIQAQSIAGLADGGFVVSWVASEYNTNPGTTAPFAVFSQEYNASGAAVGAQQTVAVLPGTTTTTPEIDAFANGQYVISWTVNGATESASFTEQGSPIASETNDTIATPATDYILPVGPHDVTLIGDYAQIVTGNNLGDTLTSNDYASTLIGGTGNDTLIAGQEANVLTGGGGDDTFVFNALPWDAGRITDFNTATDTLDLSGIFASIGYTGSNPVADGYLTFTADGSGDTQVYVDPQGHSTTIPILVTTLDGVSPSSITPADYGYESTSSSSGGGSGSGGGTGTDSGSGGSSPSGETLTANDTAGQHLTGTPGNDIFNAEQNSVIMTGDGGDNTYVFSAVPWNAGQVTDFVPGSDKLDISAILSAAGYTGSDPVADGWVTFQSDGQGDTQVYFNAHSASDPWPSLIVTLDGVSPTGLTAANTLGDASAASGGSTDAGSTSGSGGGTSDGGGSGSGSGSTVDDSQPSYTVPNGVTNVVLTGTAAQTVTANNAGDTITSNDHGSTIIGGTGNDTLIAGHGADMLTGGGGSDTFVFNYLPWNAGQITDFNTATDVLNLKGIFQSIGYTGSNPAADGYLNFVDDGHGDTQVYVDSHSASDPWPTLVTTLDHVSPSAMHTGDYLFA